MKPLTTFFDQGVLPFTGRERERGEIVHFWEETFEAQSLRVALLIGDAGIGKSRLLAETLPWIVEKGGAVIHSKLYPGATTSPILLVVQALGYSETARSLLRGEIEPTQASVATALRRIARLRPTLLVVEDIHLLEGESLREFSGLLNAIADETISLLCVARPVELEARGPLERYLVREQRLAGLSHNDVAELWAATFTSKVGEELITPLCEATQGNPLALRSALRGALQSGTLMQNGNHTSWHPTGPTATFVTGLRRNVSLLAEGMTSHLAIEDLHAAEVLATLGEVFSREAAAVMISNSREMIERLMRAGIVATNDSPVTTIYEAASQWTPLAFTHTLLHNHLAAHARVEADRLVDVVAEGHPIYSLHPLRLIVELHQAITKSEEILRRVIDRADKTAMVLDTTPNWQLAIDVWRVAATLTEIVERGASQKEVDLLETRLVHRQLSLLRRDPNSNRFRELVEKIILLTEGCEGDLVKYRLVALRWRFWIEFHADPTVRNKIMEEAEGLVEEYRAADLTASYIDFLQVITQSAYSIADLSLVRIVEQRLHHFLMQRESEYDVHELALRNISPYFLQLFDTPEELQSRLMLLQELEEIIDPHNAILQMQRIMFLESVGRMKEVSEACDQAIISSSKQGLNKDVSYYKLIRVCAAAARGASLEDIARDMQHICSSDLPSERENIGIYLSLVGLLRHNLSWQRMVVDEYLGSDAPLSAAERIGLSVHEGRVGELAAELTPEDQGELWDLVRFSVTSSSDTPVALLTPLRRMLQEPFLRIDDFLPLHAVAALIDSLREKKPQFVAAISADVQQSLGRALLWFGERNLSAYMLAIIEAFSSFLAKSELKKWREEIEEIDREQNAKRIRKTITGRIMLSMLGTIEALTPDGTSQRFQGARMKKLLATLVGNLMLPRPLSRSEFNRLVAGDEDDALARKNTNMGAVRLRDALGTEFLTMGQETNELNLDCVEVDLLEANRLLKEAAISLKKRALMQGTHAVIHALEIVRTEVPFPGLYDTFFEALRDDFEQRLRDMVISYGRELLREQDAEAARMLLNHGILVLPDDEEVAELLQKALVALGERTEAERLRIQMKEALKPL